MLLPLDADGNYATDGIDGVTYGESPTILTDENAWVNANISVFKKEVFSYIDKKCDIEQGLFTTLAKKNQMVTYKHKGFWVPVETVRDRENMETLWKQGNAKWKVW